MTYFLPPVGCFGNVGGLSVSLFLSPLFEIIVILLFDIKSVLTSCYGKLGIENQYMENSGYQKEKLQMVPEPSQPIMLRMSINRKAAWMTATDSPCSPGTCFAVHLAGAIMPAKNWMKK